MFTTTDPQGRIVELTSECYTYHILVEHPDVSDVIEIEQTIRLPDCIAQDAVDPDRLVYYRMYQRQPQRWMLKVVTDQGEVVTAYRVNRLKTGETVIWRR
ncbi:MAG: hypothetical protein U0768_09750 [Anaerolineae bacterium]